nr:hypothetical protein [Tanacetum cinerariifolium]
PNNFSEDFLLVTLGAMFEKPNIHAQIWKNQKSVHGLSKVKGWKLLESCGVQIITFTTTQLILLVERKYPLIRFTLDQMLNVIRLEVEEESEVSLELLRFRRLREMNMAQQRSKDGSCWNHVMLNAVRLEVEKESEESLELLRFIRQQHQEGQHE